MNIGIEYPERIDDLDVLHELTSLITTLQAWSGLEHKDDGAHGDVTADSVTVAGDVTAEGDGLFEGEVHAFEEIDSFLSGFGNWGSETGTGNGVPGVLLGGVEHGFLVESWPNMAASPFDSNSSELRIYNLEQSVTRATLRIGVILGVPTLIDGGSGVSLALGDLTEALASVVTQALHTTAQHRETGQINPATLTADQNDYGPTGIDTNRHIMLGSDALRTITGIVAQPDGTVLTFWNAGANDIAFAHASGLSAGPNRIICPGGVTFTLNLGDGVDFRYDGGAGVWRIKAY